MRLRLVWPCPDKLEIRALYTALYQHNERLWEAYKQDTNSEITPQLAH